MSMAWPLRIQHRPARADPSHRAFPPPANTPIGSGPAQQSEGAAKANPGPRILDNETASKLEAPKGECTLAHDGGVHQPQADEACAHPQAKRSFPRCRRA